MYKFALMVRFTITKLPNQILYLWRTSNDWANAKIRRNKNG